jgi:hypothetical protein
MKNKWFIKEFEHIDESLKNKIKNSTFSTSSSTLEEYKREKANTKGQ